MLKPEIAVVDHAPKCWRCNRQMAELLARPWSLRCPRCKAVNQSWAPTAGRVELK